MATKKNPETQFLELKEKFRLELADVEIEMDNLQMVFEEQIAELNHRRLVLRSLLFDEQYDLEKEQRNENVKRLVQFLEAKPGSSKSDIRTEVGNGMPTGDLDKLMTYARKQGLIENRGSKTRPEWHLADQK